MGSVCSRSMSAHATPPTGPPPSREAAKKPKGDPPGGKTSEDGSHPDRNQLGRPTVNLKKLAEVDAQTDEALLVHRKPRERGDATRELIHCGMKQDRVCALLSDQEIDTVLNTMEYFEFKAGECVVKQGDVGSTFFVVQDGSLLVEVNGKVVNTLKSGNAFGGLALLYKCPRTATVTAATDASVWGANGDTFHQVLKDNATRQNSDNRSFLDSISIFDGLSVKQKDIISSGLFIESFERGQRVFTQGDAGSAIYFVKKGELQGMSGGKVSQNGELQGGKEVSRIKTGESFGSQALFYKEPHSITVVALGKCELLCIGSSDLKEVLGDEMLAVLERAFLITGLRKSPEMSQFAPEQQRKFVEAMNVKQYKAGAAIESGVRFAVVIEGSVEASDEKSLGRGQWFDEAMGSNNKPLKRSAGHSGCRLGVLLQEDFARSLKGAKGGERKSLADSTDYVRKMIVIKKVPVFRHLTQDHIDALCDSFQLARFKKAQVVFKQGDVGSSFYVISAGEVQVAIGGKAVRTLGANAYFGERALLFDEPRTASIEVSSNDAQIWSVEKAVFQRIVTGKMREQLLQRIKLQDTTVGLKDLKHVRVIGVGAAGVVRLVQHKKTGMRYALKRVKKKRGKIPDEVERERKLLAENDHPMVMALVKTFETTKSVYMLTELITGGELHAAIRKIPTVLSRTQAQFYAGCLVLVLEALADRNIVYRDLKPENVMLDAQGYLKLVDFGISKKLEEGKGHTFTVIGTPHYMAPEVLTGRGYGLEVDIWSLGVLLFEFVCGFLPFADDLDDPTSVCQEVLKAPLKFPPRYRDQHGKEAMQGLLCRQPKKRLGGGINGYEDIKMHAYFRVGHEDTSLFSKIMGREIDPPLVPPGETYSDDVSEATLSDAKELG